MPSFISFFGPIGSGKTARAKLLSDFLHVPLYSELADSPFLQDMFISKRNALLNQLHFLYRDRNQILKEYNKKNTKYLIFDYHIAQVDVFSQCFLRKSEYKLFSTHFTKVMNNIPTPDLIIYLYIDQQTNIARIESRNIDYEKSLTKKDMLLMHTKIKRHLELIKRKTSVLEIDASKDVIGSLKARLDILETMISGIASLKL